jgi:hypothetical protein
MLWATKLVRSGTVVGVSFRPVGPRKTAISRRPAVIVEGWINRKKTRVPLDHNVSGVCSSLCNESYATAWELVSEHSYPLRTHTSFTETTTSKNKPSVPVTFRGKLVGASPELPVVIKLSLLFVA